MVVKYLIISLHTDALQNTKQVRGFLTPGKWFRDILRAVDYCHSSLVVHRDLKLENLLLDSQGATLSDIRQCED